MRFTIERIRTLVLAAGVLLLAALGTFLVRAKWKTLLIRHDMPQRLARDIQQEANGFTFVHTYGAHSKFKIHASREVQMRDNRILLHEVQIDLYGEDGSQVDQIAGQTFDYDQKSGLAIAEGPVEMVLTRPAAEGAGSKGKEATASGPQQIHLKTSGVTFDQHTGLVATAQRVDFTITQGFGSAIGALYDSQNGYLTLDHAVEMTTKRGGQPVEIEAQHAEFDRGALSCVLRAAKTDYRGDEAKAAQAKILFRADGTAAELDASGGVTLQSATGGRLAAPTAELVFDEHSEPQSGRLEGGVTMDSVTKERTMHGSSPTAELAFTKDGRLRQAHLERGVAIESEETSQAVQGQDLTLRVTRNWRSPVADVDFEDTGKGRMELKDIRGTGGVVITSDSRRSDEAAAPTKMTADEVTGTFGKDSVLRELTGTGHAGIEETTAKGARQTASGDRLEAEFREQEGREQGNKEEGNEGTSGTRATGVAEVQSAELDGHVVLFEQPAVKAGSQPAAPIRATAGKAVYEGTGQWLHLTKNPRVEDGGLVLTAERVDLSQQSGDAFAHGNVKATWTGTEGGTLSGMNTAPSGTAGDGTVTLGGRGPAHVIAAEAEMNESTGEATFRGHARMWQEANSVSGPTIVLNQHLQTLEARSTDPADPVRAVLLSAGGAEAGFGAGSSPNGSKGAKASTKPAAQSVMKVRGGELEYFENEHRAVMHGGALGAVVAEMGTATSSSKSVDLRLIPPTNTDGSNGGQTQVDRLTATGDVVLTAQGRRGSGEQLVYSSVTDEYVLTGTAAAPPKLTDGAQGTVTGEALIFNSRDDSVSIEGGGRETITQTTAPKARAK